MFIEERQPPKIRLLTSMQVLADQRQLNRRLLSVVSYPDAANIYVGFKLADDRITLLQFQDQCLANMYSFVVQTQVTKSLTLLKILTTKVEGKQQMYLFIGYNNGIVSVYSFDQKLVRIKDLKTDSKEEAKDIIGDGNLLGVVRNTMVEFYSSVPTLNKIRACKNSTVLCNCHLGRKLYVSTHRGLAFYERETLLKEYSIDDCCFYAIIESKHSPNVLYLGSDDDTLQVLDFTHAQKNTYAGFKSFVGTIVEKDQRLWVMGLDGRLAIFDVYPSRMSDELPPSTDRTATRFQQRISDLKHVVKAHNEGVWHMEVQQSLMVVMDTEGWIVVYETIFPPAQSSERISQ